MRHIHVIILSCILLISPLGAQGRQNYEIQGRVSRVIDGDSILVKDGAKSYEVRLWGVDSPEYTQPFAVRAKSLAGKLLKGKRIRVVVKDRDKYKRVVGLVYAGDLNINEEMVRKGAAWVYTQYCTDPICHRWKSLEQEAKRNRLGLWRRKSAVPPWKWRHRSG